MQLVALVLTSLFFVSCSNMTVGFEEDSPFYNGHIIDTREDVKGEEKEAGVVSEQKDSKLKDEITPTVKETIPQENETTFSYERDDE